jgi:hypothetical protein
MTFSEALEVIKKDAKAGHSGNRVTRKGWNGKNMYIYLTIPPLTMNLPYIVMKTVQNEYVPWLASQTDLLADDWEVVE